MNIADLDEAEGLTAEIARGYLERTGWYRQETEFRFDMWSRVNNDDAPQLRIFSNGFNLGSHLSALAEFEKRSVQSVLRDMNPRTRKGLPSLVEWGAHGGNSGLWLAIWHATAEQAGENFRFFCGRPLITELRRHDSFMSWGTRGVGWNDFPGNPEGQDWSFWPCDAHGNKLRYPKVADNA